MDSGDNEDKEEEALHCLMEIDDDIIELYDSNLSYSRDWDEIKDLYNELYDSLVKHKKELKNTLAKNKSLLEKINVLEKENNDRNTLIKIFFLENKSCNQYETYKAKNQWIK